MKSLWGLHGCTYSTRHVSIQLRLKYSSCDEGDQRWVPGQGRSTGEGNPTHSNILAWKIPCTEDPGRLQSMGLQSVGHDRVTNTFTFMKTQCKRRKAYLQVTHIITELFSEYEKSTHYSIGKHIAQFKSYTCMKRNVIIKYIQMTNK